MEKVAPNPVRSRLEELTQACSQEMRSIPDYTGRPAAAVRQTARSLLDGLATTLETGDPKYFLRSASPYADQASEKHISALGFHQAVDMLMDIVSPCSDSASDLRLMWQAARQAHLLTVPLGSSDASPVVTPPERDRAETSPAEPPRMAGDQMAEIVRREQVFEILMDHLPQKAFWKDANGVFLGCNLAFAQDAGRSSPEEMIGRTDDDMPWHEFAAKYRADDRAVMANGAPLIGVIEEHVNDLGERSWVQTSKIPVRDESGQVFAILGLFEDVTERMREAKALEENRALLEMVMSNIPQAIFWKDRAGVFLGCNQAVTEDAGLSSPADIIGKTDFDMPWKDQAEAYRADDLAVMESAAPRLKYEEPQTTPDGDTIWLSTSKIPMRDQNGEVFAVLGMYEDITSRKRMEAELEQNYELRGFQVQASTQLAQEIAASSDLGHLFEQVVRLVKEKFRYYHTQILRYDPAQDAIVLVAGYGEIGKQMLAAGHKMPLGSGLIGVAVATGQTVLRPVLVEDPDWRPNPLLPETRGEIAVPIKFRERVLGVLDVQSDRAGKLTEDDRLLLEGMCGQIAVAIEETRLRQEMDDRLQELDALYRSTSREGWEAFQQKSLQVSGYVYDRLSVQPLDEPSQALEDAASELAASKTLSIRGEVIGTLGVYADPERPLTADEQQLVDDVTEQVAQALERARLFQQTQQALSESQTLFSGSAQILRATSYQEILDVMLSTAQLAGLDRASLLFFDQLWDIHHPESSRPNYLTIMAIYSRFGLAPGQGVGERLPVETFVRWDQIEDVLKPVIITDIHTDPRMSPEMRARLAAANIRGTFVWQLHVGGEFIGYLTGQTTQSMKMGEDEMRVVTTLVEQATIVIRGLMLQQEMSERVQELTSLQRMMSREAWSAYQDQPGLDALGFLYDLVELHPVTKEMLPELAHTSRGNGHSPAAEAFEELVRLQEKGDGVPGSAASAPAYATPLSIRGETVGSLGVRLTPGRSLSTDEEEFLNAISEQVAQAMERARLMEQTQKSAVELQAVAEVGTATSTILDPDALLQQVADLTQQRFGLYHANIYMLSDTGEDLILSAGSGKVGRHLAVEGWSIPLDEENSVVATAARTRQTCVLSDVRLEAGHLDNPLLPDTRSELAVPLLLADRLLGVFNVQSQFANRFTPEDIRIYNTLAAQVAVALQNAKLYAEQLATLERMRELDNMKSAFLANMSHELRTPLNSILGFTQVIVEGLDGPTTDIMEADLELIEKNGKHLLHLINEILDMSKIESGRLSLSPEPIDVRLLMEDVLDTSAPLARNRSLYTDLVGDPAEDWMVMADQVRLRQIFINLISNAIKFTEQGGLTISLSKVFSETSEGEKSELVRIELKDTGIGIPAHKLEEIFEAFTQVDSSTTRKAGGTGLGLPISRRLVEMHGGKLWAESAGLGLGSTFVLEMPVGMRE